MGWVGKSIKYFDAQSFVIGYNFLSLCVKRKVMVQFFSFLLPGYSSFFFFLLKLNLPFLNKEDRLEGSLPRVLHSAQLCFLRCVICSKTLTQSQLLNLMSWLNFNSRCCRGESRTGMDCIITHFWGKFDIHSFIRQAHCFAVSANWEMVLRLAWIYTREPWGHRWGE